MPVVSMARPSPPIFTCVAVSGTCLIITRIFMLVLSSSLNVEDFSWAARLLRASAHPNCFALGRRTVEDFSWAVGLLRASAHPNCLALGRRTVEDFSWAVGLLRASGCLGCLNVEDVSMAAGLLRASAHPNCLALGWGFVRRALGGGVA